MATEETRRRLNDLRILEESTNKGKGESSRKRKVEESTNKGKVESTNKGKGKSIDGKTPTKIEEEGRKYCCAKCYHSYGRVTHVDLEIRVTMEPNAVVSGAKGPGRKLYYTLNFPGINSHRVEAGMLDHNTSIRKLNTVCNFCGEILGWHFTSKNDHMRGAWCTTMMDREKVVLLDEEENEVARDCDSEMPRINYLKRMNLEQVLPQGKAFRRGRPVLAQEIAQVLLAQVTAIKPAPRNLKWDYFA